jgi:aspartate racemase
MADTLIQRDSLNTILLAGSDLTLTFDESDISFPHLDCARVHLDAILRWMLSSEPQTGIATH